MNRLPFLIAGGGIAGLAASLGLARAGKPSKVFEQAQAFEEVGAGLQMSPNAVSALQYLGAWDQVEPSCVIPDEIHVRDGISGKLLQRVRLGKPFEERFGAPYRVAHRADLLAGLLAAARAQDLIELATGAQVTRAHDTKTGAELHFASGPSEQGAAVIAADGIRSAIRGTSLGWPGPELRGHVLYRALIPFERVPVSIVADTVTLWLLPGGHVVHYAVSNWRHFNIVATVEGTWASPNWTEPGRTSELMTALGEIAEPLEELLRGPVPWYKWMGADLPALMHWTKGPITLIGDAAHATLPYLAQGAAMSLEDACVLADSVATIDDAAAAFTAFAGRRMERTAAIQRESRSMGQTYHARGAARVARNAALKLLPHRMFIERLSWIYEWKPTSSGR